MFGGQQQPAQSSIFGNLGQASTTASTGFGSNTSTGGLFGSTTTNTVNKFIFNI